MDHQNHEPGCLYQVYCDESRHTSDPSDHYMVIGAISCPVSEKRALVRRIHNLRAIHATQGEFGWKKLSPNKRAFYWSLLDLFVGEPSLQFRCIVVDRTKFKADDFELGFYKLYYQMLVHWLSQECSYRIYLDYQQNRERNRFSVLRDVLRHKLLEKTNIVSLEPADSSELDLMQLADLLIGAVGYDRNGRSGSETKQRFCVDLAKKLKRSSLSQSTSLGELKFNVFQFGSQHRDENESR